MIDWSKYKHFQRWEFDSHDDVGSGNYFDPETLDMLHAARLISDVPFVINSACRSQWWNNKIGGTQNSSHLYIKAPKAKVCTAVDLSFNRQNFSLLIYSLYTVGFRRFGVNFQEQFIHADNDKSKFQPITWSYNNGPELLSREPLYDR